MRTLFHIFGWHWSIPLYVGGSGRFLGFFCATCGAPLEVTCAYCYARTAGPRAIMRLRPRDDEV